MDLDALKRFMIDLIDEEFGPRPVEIHPRWANGVLVMKPDGDTQPKEIPLDVFFKKLTGLRENLRVLEQKVNASEGIPTEERASLQSYITKCYGSLTTFNILFKNDKDKFVGSGGKSGASDPKEKLTMAEARKRLGLREHGE